MACNLFPPMLIAITLMWSQSALADLPPASGSFLRNEANGCSPPHSLPRYSPSGHFDGHNSL